jgi:hypothetical protein
MREPKTEQKRGKNDRNREFKTGEREPGDARFTACGCIRRIGCIHGA